MNATLDPQDEAGVALIAVVSVGFVKLGLRAAEGSGVATCLRRAQHPAGSRRLPGAERGRAVEESRRHRPAAATARSFPGALQVFSDRFVWAHGGLSQVPCPLVWLGRAGGLARAACTRWPWADQA